MATQQTANQDMQAQSISRDLPIAGTAEKIPSGLKVSKDLKLALDNGEVSLRFNKLIDLGDSKSAVFSIVYQARDFQGRNVSEPFVLKPPVIVSDYGNESYTKRRDDLLLKALENVTSQMPQSIVFARDGNTPVAVLVEKSAQPLLWQELKNGAEIVSTPLRQSKDYSIYNVRLEANDKVNSNIVGIYQNKLENVAPILEFEAKRMAELRTSPANEEAIRAKYIGSRGVVLSQKGLFVTSITELGDYYCEAMMFAPQFMAEYEKGCSILRNNKNEPLSGFIHVPGDKLSSQAPVKLSDQQLVARHETNSQVLARAIVGYVSQVQEVDPEKSNLKFLITGYTGFVANNPSGEYAVSLPAIDDTLIKAFGADLKKMELKSQSDNRLSLTAEVLVNGRQLNIEILGAKMPVNHSALDYSSDSVQAIIRNERPEVVISLGVRPGSGDRESFYDAGSECDNALIFRNEKLKQAFGQAAEIKLPSNDSLPAAIYKGDQILAVRNRSK